MLKRMFVIVVGVVVVSSSAAYAQSAASSQRPPETMSLSGPRIGMTYLSPGVVSQIKEDFDRDINPVISQSVLRVYELSTLYEELEPQSASRLVAIWQAIHGPAQSPAAHQPQYWHDDTKTDPVLPARPAIRWDEHVRRREG